MLLAASGYRPTRGAHHYRTLAALPLILGPERTDDADYLETCRRKRNRLAYDLVGCVTDADAEELRAFALRLLEDVRAWLAEKHPGLYD
ncbi:MAG: hypothetical protein ABIH26_00540 [Candidatus Eisenbacteria bacterium]